MIDLGYVALGVDPVQVDDVQGVHAMPVSYRTGDIHSPFIPFDEPLRIQDQHFVDCVRTGARPRTDGRRGLDVVRVLAATDLARVGDSAVQVPAGDLAIAPERVAS